MIPEVQQAFNDAFNLALQVDGSVHYFGFSAGESALPKIYGMVNVLWVKNLTNEFHLHTHGLNQVLRHDVRELMMFASDVPENARLYTNDYIDVDNESFKITSARIKDGIWNLTLNVLGSV